MLSYTQQGENGPLLFIVHGLYGSGRNWNVIAKRMSDQFRVITPDLRNHGYSFHSPSHTYFDLAADLAELIEHFGAPVQLCGHSMGGKASMTLALTKPDLIDRLVIADIAPVTYRHSQVHLVHAMRSVDLTNITRRSEVEAQLAETGISRSLQNFFTQSLDLKERKWRLNLDALEANMPGILSFPDISATFNGPTLFLSGAESSYVLPEHRPEIKAHFPKARFARLSDAGHWLHAEKPREFEATLRTFLRVAPPKA